MTGAGTISRIAPTLGMTSKALRATLIASGMLDGASGLPTIAALATDSAFIVEGNSRNGYYRAAVWRGDRLVATIPELAPDPSAVLRSFRNRHSACNALFDGLSRIRDHMPISQADLLAPLCDESVRKAVQDTTDRMKRSSLVYTAIVPIWRSLDRATMTKEAHELTEVVEGALTWLVDVTRDGPKAPIPVAIVHDPEPKRDLRLYGDSMSVRVSDQEARLLRNGATFSVGDADALTSRLASSILPTLSSLLQPGADEDTREAASRMPARSMGVGNRRMLFTMRPGIVPGSIAASAHRLSINPDRAAVKASPAAFAYLEDPAGDPLDREGSEQLVQGLVHLARSHRTTPGKNTEQNQ